MEKNNIQTPVDCTNMSVEQIDTAICCQVNLHRDSGNMNNASFYAGICKNVEDNMQRHGNDRYVSLCQCKDRKIGRPIHWWHNIDINNNHNKKTYVCTDTKRTYGVLSHERFYGTKVYGAL